MAEGPSDSFSPSTGTSAEYLAFVQNFDVLVSTVKAQPARYADLLFARGYIPNEVLEYTRLNGVLDFDKARKLVDTMMERIKIDSASFEGFIKVFKAISADFTVEMLQGSYEYHKRSLQQMQTSPSYPTLDTHTGPRPVTLDPGFECPFCAECSMEQYFSDSGCPRLLAQTDAFTFPYIRKENLEKSQIIELEARLRYETKSMVVKFAKFTLFFKELLKKQQVPLEEVKDVILSLGAFEENIGVKVLDPGDREKIKAAKSLTEVFLTLRDYISFFNYEIIQHLINNLGSVEDCCELDKYITAFNKFCKRSVFEVPPDAFCSCKRCHKTAKEFVLKCTETVATLKGVQGVKERIAVVLGLRTTALQLCSVRQGCVELHFLISTFIADHIFPMSLATESALSEIGVKVLHHQEQRTESESDTENLRHEKSGERRAPTRQTDVGSSVFTHESFPTALSVGNLDLLDNMATGPDSPQLTIQTLIRETGVTDEQLAERVDTTVLKKIARLFDSWEKYVESPGLDLSPGQIADVRRYCYEHGNEMAMYKALELWQKENPYLTYHSLLEVLLELREGSLADQVCTVIAQAPPPTLEGAALEGESEVEEIDTQPAEERGWSTPASGGVAKLGLPPGELRPPLTLKWRRGKDMPIKMGGRIQSVVIGDAIFVGGGWANNDRDPCTVMKLDLQQDEWTALPQYNFKKFALTSLHNYLLVVGGRDQRTYKPTNQVAVFQSGKWTHPYPPMTNVCHSPTAVSFNGYIIVAGGRGDQGHISSVEVLDVTARRWYTAQSLPKPRSDMKAALIGNTFYLMGGLDHDSNATKMVHHVDLNELIAKAASNQNTPTLWQTVEDTPLKYSSLLSIGRSLLAVGGRDDSGKPSSSIHLYQPDSRRWVKVGDLPTARNDCTCSVLPSGEVIIAGGEAAPVLSYLSTVDFFSISDQ